MRRLLALTVLFGLVPTWLSASGCMVCPHMLGHDSASATHADPASHESPQPDHAPSSPSDNCPCDTFCSVAPVALEVGAAEHAAGEDLSRTVLHRLESEALLTPERPPFFLPFSNAPPALG